MTGQTASPPKLSPEVRAEAALWLAHLRGPERTADVEQGFRLWLNANPENAAAFELAADIWERTGAIKRHPHERVASAKLSPAWQASKYVALAASLLALVVGALWYAQRDQIRTAVGEQRTLTLEDGSRIFLNTDTRVAVRYTGNERRILLEHGEVLFEVAPKPGRPFVVAAGDTRIQALGTSFVVRRDASQLAVTLVDGKVSVASDSPSKPNPPRPNAVTEPARVLNPGDRLTLTAKHEPALDRPPIDKVTAWQRGQVAFDNVPLQDAVDEMNRYSTKKLVVVQERAGELLIGGVFRSGDGISFAQAMAATYRLQITEEDSRIILSGTPVRPESAGEN